MSPRVSRLLQRRPLRRRVPPPLPLPLRPHLRLHSRRPLPLLQQLHQRPRPHSKETRPPQIPASPPTAADLWPLASDLRPLDGLWPLASGLWPLASRLLIFAMATRSSSEASRPANPEQGSGPSRISENGAGPLLRVREAMALTF